MNPDATMQRKKLEEMRESISRRLVKIDGDIHRRDGALERDSQEQALQLENDETMDALDGVVRRELAQIDQALEDMDNGRYGICRACGQPIAAARLEALPFAVVCIECAEKAERC